MTLIEWREEDRQFHLANGHLSYILAVHENGALGPLHVGAPLATGRSYRHLIPRPFGGFSNRLGDPVALECPTPGSGDYRVPGLVVEQPDGSTVLELAYRGHRIVAGKPPIPGLPATYAARISSSASRTRSSTTSPPSPEARGSGTTARSRSA